MWLLPWFACRSAPPPPPPIAWWDERRHGGNLFDEVETADRLTAAADHRLGFVRLVPDKWHGEGRDFLIGDADRYTGLVAYDLQELNRVLDAAANARVKVELSMLSLPGARWRQHN